MRKVLDILDSIQEVHCTEYANEKIEEAINRIKDIEEEVSMEYARSLEHRTIISMDCSKCDFFHQGYLCLENGNGDFKPKLPFYCSNHSDLKG